VVVIAVPENEKPVQRPLNGLHGRCFDYVTGSATGLALAVFVERPQAVAQIGA